MRSIIAPEWFTGALAATEAGPPHSPVDPLELAPMRGCYNGFGHVAHSLEAG